MKQHNSRGLAAGLRHLALTALLAGGTTAAQAQFYSVSNTVNQAGTYTDLGTSGTAGQSIARPGLKVCSG